jgi:integrase
MGRAAKRKSAPKRVLRLLDLEHSKRTLLSTRGSPNSKKRYEFAIDHFVAWYCSEPRLAFSKTVALRYRLELKAPRPAPATINLRLAAVRRHAFEAADTGLLSPELAAGIARGKGAKRIGVRLGNWLTADQARDLLAAPDVQTLKGRRDGAILALMLGCGLRRGEAAGLKADHLQQREEHWVIADLIGKAAHIRTVPVPDWIKSAIDAWIAAAEITAGPLFRCVSRRGQGVGSMHYGESRLARGEGVRSQGRDRQALASRL